MWFSIFFALVAASAVNAIRYDGYNTFSVGPLYHKEQAELIQSLREEHDWSRKVILLQDNFAKGRSIDLIVAPSRVDHIKAALDSADIPFKVVDFDFQKIIDNERIVNEKAREEYLKKKAAQVMPPVPTYYMNYDEMMQWLQDTARESPIATTVTIGTSYNGNTMYLMEINAGSNLPTIWIDGGIHSREWIAHSTVVWVIYEILFGTSATAIDMRTNYRWYISPCLNPDGYEYTFAVTGDRLWRKDRRPNAGNACVGTDLNRNWDANWGVIGCSSNDPCQDDYRGPSAFSSQENVNVRNAINARKANIDLFYSLHAYTQLWLVPWGGDTSKPADYPALISAANAAVAAAQAVNGLSFTAGTPPDLLYCGSGGTFDWAKNGNPSYELTGTGAGIKFAYSPELRPATAAQGGFDIPPSNIPGSGAETFAGIVASLRNCC